MTQRSQNHHLSSSTQKPRGLSRNGGRWNGELYIKIKPSNAIVTPPDLRSGYKQGYQTFLALSADNPAGNYDIECSNHYP